MAEDNDVNALILERHLGKLGAAVTRAHNGAEAVALLSAALEGATQPYDVVVMDLFMPELDGRAATRRFARRRPAPAPRGRRSWRSPPAPKRKTSAPPARPASTRF